MTSTTQPQSFFGGDPNKAHFTVRVIGRHVGLKSAERIAAHRADRALLKSLGFDLSNQFYQFTVGDNRGKALAKANAERLAKRVTEATGFQTEVSEGCFL